jgi:hypothetical protein
MKKLFFLTMLTAFALFANAQTHWTFDYHQYENSAVMTCAVILDGTEQLSDDIELGAFCGESVRGVVPQITHFSLPVPGAPTLHYFALTVWGNAGDPITFKIYDHGQEREIPTNCYTTYTFVVNGSEGTAASPYQIQLTSVYTITTNVSPAGAGTVSGTGDYENGASCSLTATANSGYQFQNWTDNTGAQVSTNATYNFTVTGDATYTANFVQMNTINVAVSPDGGGLISVNGSTPAATFSGSYAAGTQLTLTATPNQYYEFLMWTKNGDLESEEATCTITVTENATYVAEFGQTLYMITAAPNLTDAAASITGMGAFPMGYPVTLQATANPGYQFLNWTENGTVISSENPWSFDVDGAHDFVANFEELPYQCLITAHCDPLVAGTITGTGSYWAGTPCTLSVTANTGYQFQYWTDLDDNIVSEDEQFTFTVTDTVEYVAVFSTDIYLITATAAPSYGGTVTGAGGYTYNQSCTLTATPAEGYEFVNWTMNGSEVSTDAAYTFTVTEAGDYVANFTMLPIYTVTVLVDPEGAATLEGVGSDGTAQFQQGSECTVTATATNPGYIFQYWADVNDNMISEDNPFTFTVNSDTTIVASFSTTIYIINATASPSTGGTVTGGSGYHYGDTCTLIAEPATDYVFLNWTINGSVVSTDAEYTFIVTEAGDYVANFTMLPTYIITATDSIIGVGSDTTIVITGDGNYIEGHECTLIVEYDTLVYSFVNWTLNGDEVSTETSFTFTVTGDADYVANFTQIEYQITIPTVENGDVIMEGGIDESNIFHYGDWCTLTAMPAPGFYFAGWAENSENGPIVSFDNPWTFQVTGTMVYYPKFIEYNLYQINVVANPNVAGTVSGGGIYHETDNITLTATVNEGYTFVNWTLNGDEVSTDLSFDITVTENATYVANYVQDVFYVTVIEVPAEGGDVYGVIPGGYYLYGHTCVLQALPNPGYSFSRWTKDGVQVTTNAYYTFEVYANTVMTAYFTQDSYSISATADPAIGGTVSGTGTFTYGQSCTLHATAATGYTFVNWTDANGEQVSTSANYTFTVEESASFVAHFSQNLYTINLNTNPEGVAYVFIENGGNGQFPYGQSCTLRIGSINNGYNFVSWTKNGTVVSTDPTYTFTVTGNATYVANFDVDMFTITATAVPSIGGTVSGGGEFEYGQSCTLTATPRNGYTFLRWTRNGVPVSTDATYTFTVTSDGNFVAQFTTRAIQINVTATVGGEVTGAGLYEYGENVVLTAIAHEGYVFEGWTEASGLVSTDAEYTFVAEKDRDLVANFRQLTGVGENETVSIELYPNPVVNNLTIVTSLNDYQVEVYTITGALVRSYNNCTSITTINVEELSNGTYIIRLSNDNAVETRRFVKE